MKIIIFSDNVAPYRIEWAEEMGKKNNVTFVYVKDKDLERNDKWLVKSSELVKMVKLPSTVIKNHAITFNVIRYIRRHKADIVIFDGYGTLPNMFGMLYMKLHKKRYFVNVDGVALDKEETFCKHFIKKVIFSKKTYLLCSSEFTKSKMRKYNVKPENMISHNFSSIHEKDILKEAPSSKDRSLSKLKLGLKDLPTIIAVGRFLKLKQFDMLIETFKDFDKDNQLIIIGEGEEKANYKKLIAKYNLENVRILEFMNFENLKKYYYASDVLVLPSYSEVWGLVINEGMACGALPVIVSDRCVVGYSLANTDKTGYQFKYNSTSELSEVLKKVLYDEELRKKMSCECLNEIQNYTIEHMANIHLKWFKEILLEKN